MQEHERTVVVRDARELHSPTNRRGFLRALGLGGTVVLLPSVFAACERSLASEADADVAASPRPVGTVTLDLSTDVGILNYAYALEQLEAAFYQTVAALPAFASTFPAAEVEVLVDLRNHEVIHRDWFRQVLGDAAIPALQVDFTPLLGSRATILAGARAFEDLGVAAYNGAGQYLRNADFLTLAGKIVSVEARHAAAIRDILDPTGMAFANNMFETILNDSAVERALAPSAVLAAVGATGVLRTPVAIGAQPS